MSRNVIDVINQIKPIFTEQGFDTSELDSIISSKEFAPPELDHLHWERIQQELTRVAEKHLKKDYTEFPDWLQKLSDIALGKN